MQCILWFCLGAGASVLHLWLLWAALNRVTEADAERAGRYIVRSLPLRLLLMTPILILAARAGLAACASLISGLLSMRWVVCYLFERRGRRRPAL